MNAPIEQTVQSSGLLLYQWLTAGVYNKLRANRGPLYYLVEVLFLENKTTVSRKMSWAMRQEKQSSEYIPWTLKSGYDTSHYDDLLKNNCYY